MSKEDTDLRALLEKATAKLQQVNQELKETQRRKHEPIAIIGMACRFPGGANTPEAFWDLLSHGKDAVVETSERWRQTWPALAPGQVADSTRWAGLVDSVDTFDAEYFGISPREAMQLDPQHRMLLEVVAEAFERAGYPAERLLHSQTAVFSGSIWHDYGDLLMETGTQSDPYTVTGNFGSFGPGRMSYVLGLHGPSVAVDTACSTSLVAVHLACQSLRSGESDLAVAGASHLLLSPLVSDMMAQTHSLSPDGRCRTFDARANGYVRGEGSGALVLKRLSDAQRDGDTILALVRGSAVNQDGPSSGLTAPNGLAQVAVLRQALANAKVAPEQIGCIEAHGTGTALGDPIEMEALREVLAVPRPQGAALPVGSVKTNIGHLEDAAGMASLIKMVLALQNEQIPRHLHFEKLNPLIKLQGTPFVVPTNNLPWKRSAAPRFGGISGFAMSGTNAHVILEEAPVPAAPKAAPPGVAHMLPLSARTPAALTAQAERMLAFLQQTPGAVVADVAYTATVHRTHHEHRLAVVGPSAAEWTQGLTAFVQGKRDGRLVSAASEGRPREIVFVCPGQGSQWAGMGRELLANEPVFAAAMQACDAALTAHGASSVIAAMQADAASRPLDAIDAVQPTLFALQVALAALWRAWGIEPSAVIGHSMGEVAAAHIAGALSLDDAAKVITWRSRLMRAVAGKGAMLVLGTTIDEAERLIANSPGLCVAVYNGPRSVGVAGDVASIEALHAELGAQQIFCARVNTDVAFHSPHMDALCAPLAAALTDLQPRAATLPLYSTVTGALTSGVVHNAAYWVANLRQPVQFTTATAAVDAAGFSAFVELSANPVLVPVLESLWTDKPAERRGIAVGSLRRDRPQRESLLLNMAALHVRGAIPSLAKLWPERRPQQLLPTYPWQRQRYWVAPARGGKRRAAAGSHPLLGEATEVSTGGWVWETELSTAALPYLTDHQVGGAIVVPGAAYAEMLLAAGRQVFGQGDLSVEGLQFLAMLTLQDDTPTRLQVVLDERRDSAARVRISSRQGESWQLHAVGRVSQSQPAAGKSVPVVSAAGLDNAAFYARHRSVGLNYGPAFQGVQEAWTTADAAWGRLRRVEDAAYQLHPSFLDAALQVALLACVDEGAAASDPWLPVGITRMLVAATAREAVYSHIKTRQRSAGEWQGDISLLGAQGEVLAELQGVRLQKLGSTRRAAADNVFWAHRWEHLPALNATSTPLTSADTWLFIGSDRYDVTGALRRVLTEHGASIVQVTTGPEMGDQLAAALQDPQRHWRGVVHAACLNVVRNGAADELAALHQAQTLACDLTLTVVQTLLRAQAKHGWRSLPKLWLLGTPDLAHSFLWGLGRTLAYEHPEFHCCRVRLHLEGETLGRVLVSTALGRELLANSNEDEIALHVDGSRYGGRLSRTQVQPRAQSLVQTAAGQRPFKLVVDKPGALQDITLRQQERRPPAAGEVEVQMQAAGINFLDVLSALGVIPKAMSPGGDLSLGIEGAGRVCAVGSGVKDVHVGQDVIVLAPGCMASHRTVPAITVFPKPQSLQPESAATLLLVHMTAYYSLHTIAQLKKGERILIHSAAGGVGLAAIQWAQHVGAEIFVTVGTPDKREAMRKLGITHISDSRSLSFADDIMEWTHGEGVDVVLNSLAGDAIAKSLGLLRDYGRFIEIGKRDYLANASLGMQPFLRNLSFSLVDLLGMSIKRPEAYRALANDVLAKIDQGILHALPHKAYPIAEITQAFRDMSRGQHVGKLALHMRDAETTPIADAATQATCRADGTYLITGGLGGLGWGLAHWMHQQGAGNVVLIGRSAPSPEQQNSLKDLPWAHTRQADVSDPKQVRDVLKSLEKLPPVRGVIHAAAVLDDGLFAQQTPERFAKVIAPKAWGAWNLHCLTEDLPLDFFILYSSAAALLGNPGQSNYAAANAFLDTLAELRRSRGQPALCINWGPFADVGMAAGNASRGERLAARGMTPITAEQGQTILASLMQSDVNQIGVLQLDPASWLRAHPPITQATLLTDWVRPADGPSAATSSGSAHLQRLREAPVGRRLSMLEDFLRDQIAALLRVEPAKIKRDAPFKSLGVDSLIGMELRNQLERDLALQLSATVTWTHPTVSALSKFLAGELQLTESRAAPPTAPVAPPPEPKPEPPAIEANSPPRQGISELIAAIKDEL